MPERPTPEQVVAGGIEDSRFGTRLLSEQVLDALRAADMVVGYPDSPEVLYVVLNARAVMDDEVMEEQLRLHSLAWLSDHAADPIARRTVLAALPEEAPAGFYREARDYTRRAKRAWRWLREEAFEDV